MSDNGAAGKDFYNAPIGSGPFLREHYNNSYENRIQVRLPHLSHTVHNGLRQVQHHLNYLKHIKQKAE